MTPYNTALAGFALAMFASCNSGKSGVNGYYSLVKTATDAGVDNVIGFRQKIFWIEDTPNTNLAGDAFLRAVWKDIGGGSTYDAALTDAAASAGGYGFNSYVHNREAGAPNRPVASAVPSTPSTSASAAMPSSDWRDRLFAEVTDQDDPVLHDWVEEQIRGTTVLNASGPEGIITVDPASGTLLGAVLEQGFVDRADQAASNERDLAAKLFLNEFGNPAPDVVLAKTDRIDHGSWTEVRYTFRDQASHGFGPNVATVSVNEQSGAVASYAASWVQDEHVKPSPISRAEAIELATRAAGFDDAVVNGSSLDWQVATDPEYVWTVQVSKPIDAGRIGLLETASVELEAETGQIIQIARG